MRRAPASRARATACANAGSGISGVSSTTDARANAPAMASTSCASSRRDAPGYTVTRFSPAASVSMTAPGRMFARFGEQARLHALPRKQRRAVVGVRVPPHRGGKRHPGAQPGGGHRLIVALSARLAAERLRV